MIGSVLREERGTLQVNFSHSLPLLLGELKEGICDFEGQLCRFPDLSFL
jgi:hypothetical protein